MLTLVLAAAPLHLVELVDEARRNNPELRQARVEAESAAAAARAAGTFDDPMLMVQLWNAPVDFSSVPLMVQLSQQISLGGKRAARRDAAEHAATGARAGAAVKVREIEAAVAKAYFDVYLADRTLEIDAEIESTLTSLLSAASARIAAGKGEEAEALRAQAEQLKVRADREAVAARRTGAAARLLALLARPAGSELGATAEPAMVEGIPPLAALRDRATRDRAEIAMAQAAIDQAEAELRLAQAEPVPDLNVFIGEMHSFRSPGVSDFLFAGVQGNLPLFSALRRSPKVEAATARVAALRAALESWKNRVAAEVDSAFAELVAARHEVELHHQLIPVARQALSSATASYAAGRGSFLMVLDSERDLLMHELDLATHTAMYEQALADLERAVGGDLGLVAAAEAGHRVLHQEPR